MPDQDDVLQLVTETATVHKRDQVVGRVRVHTRTELADQLVSAALDRTDVEVTHVPVDQDIEVAPPIRTEGDTTIVPVVEEILVVEKRLVLREEIHIRQITTTQSVELPVTLRKQRAVIERDDVHDQTSEEEN